jgi:hypothetical protein
MLVKRQAKMEAGFNAGIFWSRPGHLGSNIVDKVSRSAGSSYPPKA